MTFMWRRYTPKTNRLSLARIFSSHSPSEGKLMGVGGAPEGVISAAAIRCAGGDMQGRLQYRSDEERARARALGLTDLEKVLSAEDMAGGDVMFAATGVTSGNFLKGVRFTGDGARSHSVVMRSRTGTVRYIETIHRFSRTPDYGW